MQSPESTVSTAPETARTAFNPHPRERYGVLDGAWWPRSRDLSAELPALLATLRDRDVVVTRVAYGRDSWDPVARKLWIAGRRIALGWFRTIDPHSVSVTSRDGRNRLDLLVVPATSDAEVAERAFALVVEGRDRDGASATLSAASADSETDSESDSEAERGWVSEGGSR